MENGRVVYFIRAVGVGLVKIGVANCVHRRLGSIRQVSPVPLEVLGVIPTPKGSILEQRMHGRFKHLRQHGEWFTETDELLAFITSETLPAGSPKRSTMLEARQKNARRRAQRRDLVARRQSEAAAPAL